MLNSWVWFSFLPFLFHLLPPSPLLLFCHGIFPLCEDLLSFWNVAVEMQCTYLFLFLKPAVRWLRHVSLDKEAFS